MNFTTSSATFSLVSLCSSPEISCSGHVTSKSSVTDVGEEATHQRIQQFLCLSPLNMLPSTHESKQSKTLTVAGLKPQLELKLLWRCDPTVPHMLQPSTPKNTTLPLRPSLVPFQQQSTDKVSYYCLVKQFGLADFTRWGHGNKEHIKNI